MRRCKAQGSLVKDRPLALSAHVEQSSIQGAELGAGPLFIVGTRSAYETRSILRKELAAHIEGDLNSVSSPTRLERFITARGETGVMRVGDEYLIRMPGPWDGPVSASSLSALLRSARPRSMGTSVVLAALLWYPGSFRSTRRANARYRVDPPGQGDPSRKFSDSREWQGLCSSAKVRLGADAARDRPCSLIHSDGRFTRRTCPLKRRVGSSAGIRRARMFGFRLVGQNGGLVVRSV